MTTTPPRRSPAPTLGLMDHGDYSTCHPCRRPIAHECLLIMPQARYCARCQQVRGADR